VVHGFLTECYWARGITRDVVERSIRHSLCFGIYHEGAQVGFARVITDHATFAYLADVFVLPAHRGHGLGKWLMECIVSHRELQGLRRFMLGTRDAHGLYAQFGFAPPRNPAIWMEIHNDGVYQPTGRAVDAEGGRRPVGGVGGSEAPLRRAAPGPNVAGREPERPWGDVPPHLDTTEIHKP
jgi:GNAT superfamily N-acetyltransferase